MKYIIIFLAILLTISFTCILLIRTPHNSQEAVIEIEKGATAAEIAELLYSENVIRNRHLFVLYVKITGSDKHLSYGEFYLPAQLSLHDIVKKLESGRVILYPTTIVEGLTIDETAISLAEDDFVDYDTFISLCRDSTFAYELTGLRIKSLEGLLYPETYHFPRQVSESYIIQTLVNEFFKQVSSLELTGQEQSSYNLSDELYDAVILASIIEQEATFSDEKPLISGVYHNRLAIGKRLQADPTVAYALKQDGIIRTTIYYRDLRVDSPYNTYRNTGLPPAPICSPSLKAIEAALNPEETEYLFFFSNNRGRHIFSKTYQQHLNGLRRLRSGS